MNTEEQHLKIHEEMKGDRIIGRNPTTIPVNEFSFMGIKRMDLIDVIRERCIDCKMEFKPNIAEEIRNCRARECASWPYRMGVNPFVKPRIKKVEVKKQWKVKTSKWIYE